MSKHSDFNRKLSNHPKQCKGLVWLANLILSIFSENCLMKLADVNGGYNKHLLMMILAIIMTIPCVMMHPMVLIRLLYVTSRICRWKFLFYSLLLFLPSLHCLNMLKSVV